MAIASVTIARWRYAIVNFPHPLLEMGLTILDTPGLDALATEPELTMHRLQEADAVVFMLSVDSGATAKDLDLWHGHVEPMEGLGHTRYVVLNKIDDLRESAGGESEALAEIDRQVRKTAEVLGVDPTQVFPLSARQGLAARIEGDGDAFAKSRLYRLEQALSQGLVHARRVSHATSVRAETRTLLAEARTLLESRRAFVEEQVEDLGQLQGKNQKLVDSLGRKASDERHRIEEARTALTGLRAVHNRHADELAVLLDPNYAREAGLRTRTAVLESRFSAGIGELVDAYFRLVRNRITRAIEAIGEVKAMMATVNRKFAESWGLTPVEVAPFSTDRFLLELDRLEEYCSRDFRSASSLLVRGRRSLAALFFDTVALKTIHVHEIADREVRAWMNSFIRPLEAQLLAIQELDEQPRRGNGEDPGRRIGPRGAHRRPARIPARVRGARPGVGSARPEARTAPRRRQVALEARARATPAATSRSYFSRSSTCDSFHSGLSGMQSTGHTSRHCGASKCPTHSVHLPGSIT